MPPKADAITFLKEVNVFSSYSDEELGAISQHITQRTLKKGETLFYTGDDATQFYIIKQGWVKLFRVTRDGQESVLSILHATNTFGRHSVLANSQQPYSAELLTDSTLLSLSAESLRALTTPSSKTSNLLSKILEDELNSQSQYMLENEHLSIMNAQDRLGCFLLKLCGTQLNGKISIDLPYEKSLVANKLGMTAETFSRTLKQLAKLGVHTQKSTIIIDDIAILSAHICEHCSATKKECGINKEISA